MASVASISLQHQVTSLSFLYSPHDGGDVGKWYCQSKSTIYIITDDPPVILPPATSGNSTAQPQLQHQLALHLRGCCSVTDVKVDALNSIASGGRGDRAGKIIRLLPLRTTYHHVDPLQHVLIKPIPVFAREDNGVEAHPNGSSYAFDADSQSTRGAFGMTTSLRAASIASNMGELRISVTTTAKKNADINTSESELDSAILAWKNDISSVSNYQSGSNTKGNAIGSIQQKLLSSLGERSSADRRTARIDLIAKRMAIASGYGSTADGSTNTTNRAFKITVHYKIALEQGHPIQHLAGLHVFSKDDTPHIFTTAGIIGDSEGPRSWIPCCENASVKSRGTHCLSIKVTAPATEGLSCIGCGEDFGAAEALLHETSSKYDAATTTNTISSSVSQSAVKLQDYVGAEHIEFLQRVDRDRKAFGYDEISQIIANRKRKREVHVIPPEEERIGSSTSFMRIDDLQASFIWCSQIWTPVPARSLGFAIGPFKVLEDPEYFGPTAFEQDVDDDDDSNVDDDDDGDERNDVGQTPHESRVQALLEATRRKGEGFRQAYFAPKWERKYIHTTRLISTYNSEIKPTSLSPLLPNTQLFIPNFSENENKMSDTVDKAVTFATSGVVHRALSLMRDVLALPTYRTTAYTQIWIPNAVHGGSTSGSLHHCPECLVNPFLGGSIMDSRLLPPPDTRLPYYNGGRVLQFLQARCAIRGWITAAIPIGGHDDVGNGYLYTLIESFIMSLYERGHGGFGEGGAKGSMFYCARYAASCGLNSSNLDFLPVQNIEEIDMGGFGAVPVEERHNDQLWRGANNGSESHTSAMDEFNFRQVLYKDAVEALERLTDKLDVPSPSMGWFGSHLSLSFLSSNATSSSDIGCGALDLLHPIGGLVYRSLKSEVFRGVVEGRAGTGNFIRLVRAAFIASHLEDLGEKELKLPQKKKKSELSQSNETASSVDLMDDEPQPPFVICVNEILKKKGLQHTLFTRVLQNLSGRIREQYLAGTLVDVERNTDDPRTRLAFVDPEGFPNSYVRAASTFFLKVGVLVEASKDTATQITKGIQMQAYAEPIVPKGGVAFGGPITIRVVENEGSYREFVKDVVADGSRRDWGATYLHAKPVTTAKAQMAASGAIETTKDTTKSLSASRTKASTLGAPVVSSAFTETNFHSGGYQAIELIRLTNLTPLLWVRVDPMGLYGGRIAVVLPDACLAEQLFHDGDAGAQVDAIRALSERPLRVQGTMKVTTVYDVNVSELPVRLLGDCFRGSPALHSSLPHTPAVRCQAALASAIWQNNKAPNTKDSVGSDNWVGINILIQYFRERFYSNSVVMPVKFSRLVMKKSEAEVRQTATNAEGAAVASAQPAYDATYLYLDSLDIGEEIADALDEAEEVEMEEDEEYRVRSAVTTAIASIRAKDGMTPPLAIQFLETILESEDAEMVSNLVFPDEELMMEKARRKRKATKENDSDQPETGETTRFYSARSYVSSFLIADTLLALCHINSMPAVITDPTTGKSVQATGTHPLSRLLNAAKSWLQWELFRDSIRSEEEIICQSGVSGNCYDVATACAVIGLSNLCIAIQSTTDYEIKTVMDHLGSRSSGSRTFVTNHGDAACARYYLEIFDSKPYRSDPIRAACAQALTCVCCAADRFEEDSVSPLGLLCALEFLLNRIIDPDTSPSLRHTLSLIMMDACTGKVCSMQRVGAIAGRNELVTTVNRFFNGPLGATYGGDNGAALLMSVSAATFPAASAVNDGARRGLPVITRAGHPKENTSEILIVRVARFATRLWRTINGEPADPPLDINSVSTMGVCAYDGILRCSLLALLQRLWPRGCFAVLQVQSWKSLEKTQRYKDMGANEVMRISDEEKVAASEEEKALSDINRVVQLELDRQNWRGAMARKGYEFYKASKNTSAMSDVAASEQGIGQSLPPIERDSCFKSGGWIASAAQQRRALALDGGTAVTKVRLTVKSAN